MVTKRTASITVAVSKVLHFATALLGALLAVPSLVQSQTGANSSTADNSTIIVEPGTVELRFAETSYFGPNTSWEINGTLEIWSPNIWIAPTARFTGTGTIIIHNPGTNPFYEDMPPGPTYLDGNNGRLIGVAVELRNPNNLVLADLPDPGYGAANPAGPQAAALRINSRFEFATDGGDVLLNGHDFYVGEQGSLAGYNRDRMVVTGNSIAGHLVKAYDGTAPFTFPVGITEGDYTPATLSPASTATMYVAVQDYAASDAEVPQPRSGMDRVWHIYADKAVYTAYTLQHNSITNGGAYVDEEAQIAQYAGSGNWIGGHTERIAQGVHARDWLASVEAQANDGWLTKLVSGDRAPQATDDVARGPSGRRLTVPVLENDLPGNSPLLVSTVHVLAHPRNGTVFINSDGSITYTSHPKYVGEDSFIYEVTDENGLKDFATVHIDVLLAELLIPNAVTPNDDGRNDVFAIQGLENYDQGDLTIFNRWGNEVYRSRDYQQDWAAEGVSDGAYYYRLVLVKDGMETIHSGWVLVKRQ